MRKHLGTLGVVAAIIALFALAMILGTRQAPGEGEAFVHRKGCAPASSGESSTSPATSSASGQHAR